MARQRRRAGHHPQPGQILVDPSGRRRRAGRTMGALLAGLLLLLLVALIDPLFVSRASGPPAPAVFAVLPGGKA
ncbi:hypothetical protein [Streptomyces flaveus]|uniref:hypothetical protein n=1 Tax=Streptomyces flaveus TaxID=66370 RepID=UPI00331C0143